MPADTPSLDDLISIFSNVENLRATFNVEDGSFPNAETAHTITFTFMLRRSRLDFSAEPFAFGYPSKLFPETARLLGLMQELLGISSMMEEAYRFGDPKKSIDDAIAFIEQELNQDTNSLGTLYTKMRQEHFSATLKYLVELRRRREEAEARQAGARRRKEQKDEEERQREREEKRRKWEEEEAKKRAWQRRQTSDSGYARGSAEERAWDEFRKGGGFEHMRGSSHFGSFEEMRRAAEEELRRRYQRYTPPGFDDLFGNKGKGFWEGTSSNSNEQKSTPPAKKKWFEILGCPASATADQIRKAARNAAKGLHPDKNKDPEAIKKFQEISEAKAEGLGGL